MATFFTADTHFGHGGALGLFRRPFASVAEMDAELERRWNAAVGVDDEVWHLGDVAVGRSPAQLSALLARLHGRKHLILGNNDTPETASLPGWASVQAYAELELEGAALVLCHYPFRSWRNMHRGWLNLHGHCHGRLARLPRQADMGVEAWDYRPVTLAEIRAVPARGGRAGKPANPGPAPRR